MFPTPAPAEPEAASAEPEAAPAQIAPDTAVTAPAPALAPAPASAATLAPPSPPEPAQPQLVEVDPNDPWLAPSGPAPAPGSAAELDFRKTLAAHQREEELLVRCVEAIDRKGQIVLCGTPGSGKGRLARRLAARLVEGSDGLRAHLAFHAQWTYADFIQHELPDGQRRLGRFTAFCRKAAERRGRCVLVIEDLQRAAVAEVFGEALVLLEQRGSELTLAGGGSLSIPRNVRLIATVDSSLDEVSMADPVLRHRFEFISLDQAD